MRQLRGFTLIEILVVLALVGILSGLLLLQAPDRRRQDARTEAERLHALLLHAGNEAVLGGVELGLAVRRDGYEFVRFDAREGAWLPPSSPVLRARQLPAELSLELLSGQSRLPLHETRPGRDARRPALLLLSSGETTPFHLSLGASDAETFHLLSDGFSGIRLDRQHASR